MSNADIPAATAAAPAAEPTPASADRIFITYMQPILQEEGRGRLTNNIADRGGVTIWGITEKVARAAGYTGAMADMTLQQAMAIFKLFFWTQPGFDQISLIMPDLGRFMLDIGINCGPTVPSMHLQRALNVLNNQGRLYTDLGVDGHCGAMTRAALNAYRMIRNADKGDAVLLGIMRSLAAVRYIEIAESDKTQETNEYGWIAARALSLGAPA